MVSKNNSVKMRRIKKAHIYTLFTGPNLPKGYILYAFEKYVSADIIIEKNVKIPVKSI